MASPYTPPVQLLIDELGRLPGIGPRSAQRLALHLIKGDVEDVTRLARALVEAKERVRFCGLCFNLADAELCNICGDTKRDSSIGLGAIVICPNFPGSGKLSIFSNFFMI